MAKACIYYKQSPHERYNTDMSKDVAGVLSDFSIVVEGADGGTAQGEFDWHAQIAEEELDVVGSKMNIELAVSELEARYEREFTVSFVTWWSRFKDNVRWKLIDWNLAK